MLLVDTSHVGSCCISSTYWANTVIYWASPHWQTISHTIVVSVGVNSVPAYTIIVNVVDAVVLVAGACVVVVVIVVVIVVVREWEGEWAGNTGTIIKFICFASSKNIIIISIITTLRCKGRSCREPKRVRSTAGIIERVERERAIISTKGRVISSIHMSNPKLIAAEVGMFLHEGDTLDWVLVIDLVVFWLQGRELLWVFCWEVPCVEIITGTFVGWVTQSQPVLGGWLFVPFAKEWKWTVGVVWTWVEV